MVEGEELDGGVDCGKGGGVSEEVGGEGWGKGIVRDSEASSDSRKRPKKSSDVVSKGGSGEERGGFGEKQTGDDVCERAQCRLNLGDGTGILGDEVFVHV